MTEPAPSSAPHDSSPRATRAPLLGDDRRAYAWTIVVFAAVVVACRLWPVQVGHPLNLFEAYAAYALLPIWPALAYARWRKIRDLTAACLLLGLAHLGWALDFVPRMGGARACAEGEVPLRVVTANLLAPAPSEAFARELLAMRGDVIVASELSDLWSQLLAEEGVYAAYPEVRADVIPATRSYFGIGILSRHTIVDDALDHVDRIPMLRADVVVDGAEIRVRAFHAHPPTSASALALWEEQLARLEANVERDVAEGRAVVVAGDFNTTTMTRGYRGLLAGGLVAVHEAAARPFATTWPNGLRGFPPVRIDHVLVHRLGVSSVWEGDGDGSDHRPIVADLCAPRAIR